MLKEGRFNEFLSLQVNSTHFALHSKVGKSGMSRRCAFERAKLLVTDPIRGRAESHKAGFIAET